MTFDPVSSIGPFLQTSVFLPENFEEYRVKFLALYRDIANDVNVRQIGVYDLQEFLAGQFWFTSGNPQVKRQVYRKVIEVGAIAPGVTSTTAHGITQFSTLTFTHLYGVAQTAASQRPIPFANVTNVNLQIELQADNTNIYVVNGAAAPAITSANIVLEYLKN